MSQSSSSTGSNNNQNIQLVIRCALQTFEDLTINCPLEWKVGQLKGHLNEICPTKPDPKRQKLIYAGHCLKDTQTLREIADKASDGFEPGEEAGPQVIHFVCASKEPTQLPPIGLRHRPNANASNNNNSNNVGAAAAGFNAAGQQNLFAQNATSFTPMNTVAFPQYQIPANATPEQMAYYYNVMSYQQAVMTWMQYNQAAGGGVVPQQIFAASQFSPFVQAGPYNVQFNLQAGHGINNPLQQQMVQQNAQNMGNNQAPQVAANEEEHVNDILGILYKSIRVGFFLMVLFFYSSFERFLAVFLIVCILWYVHRQREQNNLNAAARRVVQAPQPPPRVETENNGQAEAENGDQAIQQQNDNNNNEVPAPQQQPNPPQGPAQTTFNLFCSTVSSFFLSLIPENPVPMDVGE